jgi:hypothetical protein
MDEGDRSPVSRSLITNAWPPKQSYFQENENFRNIPIALADPGKTSEVVTPPEIDSRYDSSWVFKASRLRSHG